jgi:hypothetical protein
MVVSGHSRPANERYTMARGRHPHSFARAGGQVVAAALRAAQNTKTYWLKRCEPYPAYTNRGLRSFCLTGSTTPLANPGELVHGPYGSIEAVCEAASQFYGTSAAEQVAEQLDAIR